MKNAKKLIVGLMLSAGFIGVATAAPILVAPNQMNGQIVLTDNQGGCSQEFDAYYTTNVNGDPVTTGCWTTDNNGHIIGVDLNTGIRYVWPADGFEATVYGRREYGLN